MEDFIIQQGDFAVFMPTFEAAVVVVQPGKMEASGKSTLKGKKICIDGDESKVAVTGCMYTTPQYSIPGTGTLKIESLASDQKTIKSKSGNKPIIIKGSAFNAVFEVQSPAQQPNPPGPPVPDSKIKYKGNGNFKTTNTKWKAG